MISDLAQRGIQSVVVPPVSNASHRLRRHRKSYRLASSKHLTTGSDYDRDVWIMAFGKAATHSPTDGSTYSARQTIHILYAPHIHPRQFDAQQTAMAAVRIGALAGSAKVEVSSETVLAFFSGRVNRVSGEKAVVSLVDTKTGEEFEADCELSLLIEHQIHTGDEFEFKVLKNETSTSIVFQRLAPKSISKEQALEIMSEFENRWKHLSAATSV